MSARASQRTVMSQSAKGGGGAGLCINADSRIRPESEFLLLRAQVLMVLAGEMTILKQLTDPWLFAWAPSVLSSTFRPHATAKKPEATEGHGEQSVSALGLSPALSIPELHARATGACRAQGHSFHVVPLADSDGGWCLRGVPATPCYRHVHGCLPLLWREQSHSCVSSFPWHPVFEESVNKRSLQMRPTYRTPYTPKGVLKKAPIPDRPDFL